jgi:hypothetical protein
MFENIFTGIVFFLFIINAVQYSISWSRFMKVWKNERIESGRGLSNRQMIDDFYFHDVSPECQLHRTACWRSLRRFAFGWVIFAAISFIPDLLHK